MKQTLILILIFQNIGLSQEKTPPQVTFSGYTEAYYSYDFGKPNNHEKPNFIYNHKRHNEVNINLAYLKTNYASDKMRLNTAAMFGNYAQYNLSAEPTWAQFIYEANVGVKLSRTKNIWLDMGIMPSHIGFESAVGADCWNLTRSLLAENSPYYEAGAKISYTSADEKYNASLLYLNGWQRIKRPDGIQQPSFGAQFNYKPTKKLTLNYSNFIGTDKPDSLNAWRFFNNFYAIYEPNKTFGIIAGLDIGTEKGFGTWYSPVLITRFALFENIKLAFRGEYYNDSKQVIVATNSKNGFQVVGVSTNLDYQIFENALWRIEGKILNSKDKIFENKNQNFSITSAITVKF
jgi:Putative beta-barrel porin-2, OmpL-like. bbp2